MIQLKTRKEKLYAAMQQAANQRQLELAKAANVEKLVSHAKTCICVTLSYLSTSFEKDNSVIGECG